MFGMVDSAAAEAAWCSGPQGVTSVKRADMPVLLGRPYTYPGITDSTQLGIPKIMHYMPEGGDEVLSELSDMSDSDLTDSIVDDNSQIESADAVPLSVVSDAVSPARAGSISPVPDALDVLPSVAEAVVADIVSSTKRRRGKKSQVRVRDSEEEDMEAMALDDSMFNKSSSVKVSLLPPPVATRSSSKRPLRLGSDSTLESEGPSDVETSPSKKSKSKKGGGKRVDAIDIDPRPTSPALDLEQYLASYMAKQGPLLAQSVLKELMPALTSTIKDSVAALVPNPLGAASADVDFVTPPRRVVSSSLALDPSLFPKTPGSAVPATPVMGILSSFSSLSAVTPSPALSTASDVFGPSFSTPLFGVTGSGALPSSSVSSVASAASAASTVPLLSDVPAVPPTSVVPSAPAVDNHQPAASAFTSGTPAPGLQLSVPPDEVVDAGGFTLAGFDTLFDGKPESGGASDVASQKSGSVNPSDSSRPFLEDLENYKANL
ncbi:hypothetical protein B0H11DRAFT_2214625 [Mycena galericulata]|nr:hypothetical protein B0H11DRAFT_2214625 [Mycena galericulata]